MANASLTCSNCGCINTAGAENCQRCRSPLDAGAGARSPAGRVTARKSALLLALPLAIAGFGFAVWIVLRANAGESAESAAAPSAVESQQSLDSNPAPSASTAAAWDPPSSEALAASALMPATGPSGLPVTAGSGAPRGELPPEVIQAAVRGASPRIKACYQHGLERNPDLAGTVTVRFVIAADGTVPVAMDNHSSFADERVVACILDEVKHIHFPPPHGGPVTVAYPFVFSTGAHDEGQH